MADLWSYEKHIASPEAGRLLHGGQWLGQLCVKLLTNISLFIVWSTLCYGPGPMGLFIWLIAEPGDSGGYLNLPSHLTFSPPTPLYVQLMIFPKFEKPT